MTAPPSVDDLLDLTERSGLLSAAQLAPYRTRSGEAAEDVARSLIRDRLLTPFQARQLLRGKHRGFFVTEKYKILDHLGEGGMGRVLLCEHLILHRLVAVKLLHVSGVSVPGAEERFFREGRAAAQVVHPNLVHVYDMERAGATPFMVMEYVDGTNLHQLVAERGLLEVNRAVEYVKQAAVGLHHAHRAGLVHRDIKPGNLILDRTGTVKVLDLGLARFYTGTARNQSLTQKFDAASILGTADFIAPEQTMDSSKVDIRADVYSLGISFYFLLSGKMPFAEGTAAQKILWHQTRDPEPVTELRPDVPPGVVAVLEKMIRKDPAERYQTPAEVVVALRPLLTAPVAPPPPEEMPKVRPTAYQLGVSPPPSAAVLGIGPPDPTTPHPGVGSTPPHAMSPPSPVAAARPASSGVPIGTPDQAPTSPTSVPRPGTGSPGAWTPEAPASAPVTGPLAPVRTRRAVLFAVAGVVVAAVVGVAIWAATQSGNRPDTKGGPVAAPPLAEPGPSGPLQVPPAPPSPGRKTATLKGSGSTLAAPVMQRWAALYEAKTGLTIDYEPVGSSRGVQRMINRDCSFACTDAFLDDKQLADARGAGGEMIHVPLVVAPVVVGYNLPALKDKARVRFTGPVLAAIYSGKIARWSDPRLAAANPGVDLPDLAIAVVHRSEGSGTTFVWTEFLSKSSPGGWTPGVGNVVEWPVGVGASGNDGVAVAVSRTEGAIGYVDLTSALANDLRVGLVKNRTGEYVDPHDPAGVTAAAEALLPGMPDDLRFSLVDAPGPKSYPIAATTWAVFYANPPGDAKELVAFLRWATHEGQAEAAKLRYVPLPPELVRRIDAKLDRL
jgi:phosphate ABC transporter phosphate-binding protein